MVVVYLGHSQSEIRAQILTRCGAELARYEIPDDVLFWESIPMTGTGKMDKKAVRSQLQAQQYLLPSLRSTGKANTVAAKPTRARL